MVLNEFADFLGSVVNIFFFLLSDFHINICCPIKTFPRDFCNLIDSLNLTVGTKSYTYISIDTLWTSFSHTASLSLTLRLGTIVLWIMKCYVLWTLEGLSLSAFQKAVKSAKSKYLSEIITKSSHCPKILFSTIDSVLNPMVNVFSDVSGKNLKKAYRMRPQMQSNLDTDGTPWSPAIWPSFDPVTRSTCKNINWTFKTHRVISWCYACPFFKASCTYCYCWYFFFHKSESEHWYGPK